MIVVTGSVTRQTVDESQLSLEHVHRSRAEPGASRMRHVDCENPLRLVFFEQWADRALCSAFRGPRLRDSSVRCIALPVTIELYDATS